MAKSSDIAVVKDGAVYVLQAGTPVFVKTADICAITGKSNQWIGQLTSQGTLAKKKTSFGTLYEMVPTMSAYIDMIDSRLDEQSDDDKKIEKARRVEEVRFKKAKATMASLQADELQGKMHRSEDVCAMTEDLIFAIRGALLALPGRLAVDVVAAKDPAEASEIIRAEIYKVMEELSNYKYDSAKYEERVRERMKMDTAVDYEDEEA